MSDLNNILAQRASTHGDFEVNSAMSQGMKALLMQYSHLMSDAEPYQLEALSMILHKISRICAGNPHFVDHWDDIAGYAKLTADTIRKNQGEW